MKQAAGGRRKHDARPTIGAGGTRAGAPRPVEELATELAKALARGDAGEARALACDLGPHLENLKPYVLEHGSPGLSVRLAETEWSPGGRFLGAADGAAVARAVGIADEKIAEALDEVIYQLDFAGEFGQTAAICRMVTDEPALGLVSKPDGLRGIRFWRLGAGDPDAVAAWENARDVEIARRARR